MAKGRRKVSDVERRLIEARSLVLAIILPIAILAVLGLRIEPVRAQSTLTTAAQTPPQSAVATVVLTSPGVGLCPDLNALGMMISTVQIDLRNRCREVVTQSGSSPVGGSMGGLALAETRTGLQEFASEEITLQGTSSVETSNSQFTNVTSRLAALRGGATGLSISGLTLTMNGQSLPGTIIASLLPSSLRDRTFSRNSVREAEYLRVSHAAMGSRGELPSNGLLGRYPYAAMGAVEPAGALGRTDALSRFRRLGIFVNGTLAVGDKDATKRESGFDFDTLGVTAGVDYRFTDSFVPGVAFGYTNTDADLESSGGSLDVDAYSVSVYGTYDVTKKFYVDGIVTFGWNDYDIKRNINYSILSSQTDAGVVGGVATVNQTAESDTDGTWYALAFSGGYDFSIGGFTLGPLARVNYTKADIDGYGEKINNTLAGFGLALDFDDQDVESLTTVLGGQGSYAVSTPWAVLLPQVRFEWEHEYKNDNRTISAFFVNDPSPGAGTQVRLKTDRPDRDFFNLSAGISATFPRGISVFVNYETVLGLEDVTAHNVVFAGLRVEF